MINPFAEHAGTGRYESPIEERLGRELFHPHLKVFPQAQIGKYRVDFLVEWIGGVRPIFAAVECDGDEFHNSGSQKVADAIRQNEILALGVSVIRFTGSEITRDAQRCVDAIVGILECKARESF